MTFKDRIVALLKVHDGLTDREIADELLGKDSQQQYVNQICNQLHARGMIRRQVIQGRLRNFSNIAKIPQFIENSKHKQTETVRERIQNFLLSETTIIVIVPFFATFILFSFFQGYFSYFNMPDQFIAMDLAQVLSNLISISIPIYVLVFLIMFYLRIRSKEFISLSDVIYFCIACVFQIILVLKLFSFENQTITILTICLPVALIITSIIDKPLKKIIVSKKRPGFTTPHDTFDFFSIGGFLLIFVSLMFYLIGYFSAQKQETFYIVRTSPEVAVLYLTSEKAVVAGFDRTTKTLDGAFRIVKIGDDPELEYHLENVGPLKSIRIK